MEKGENSRLEEETVCLLQYCVDQSSVSDSGNGVNRKEQVCMVYFSTFVALCGSFQFGICSGYSSPTESAISEDLGLSTEEFSVFGSILTCGAMMGAFMSGYMADLIGRKGAMGVSSSFCIAGWIAIYFAKGALALDIGRFATGCGMGAFSYVVPVFIAEIAPKNLRGALTTLSLLTVSFGITTAYSLGAILSWRNLALTGLIPCAIQLFSVFLIPESPRWLAMQKNQKEFVTALKKLRGNDADISDEASEIQDSLETQEQFQKNKMVELFEKKHRRPLIIGVGMMVFQQFGGISGICYYMSSIIQSIGVSADIGSITYSTLQIVVCSLLATKIDKYGRKPFLLVSASGMFVGSILLGASFLIKENDTSLKLTDMLAIFGLMVYGGSSAAGMAVIPWVLIAEMFPISIKGAAGSLATFVNWFGAWTVSFTFSSLISWSSYGTFFVCAGVNALAVIFILAMVTETKGKSLEEIQAVLNA